MDDLGHREKVLIRLIMKANQRKKQRFEMSAIEVSAEIRNRLQSAKTVLEFTKAGKQVPKELIERALIDLEEVVKELD